MLAATLLALALAAPAPTRVLVLETRGDAGYVDKVRAFGDLFATVLEQRTHGDIVPASSVKDRLAVSADKAAAGCDDSACMSEIAGALDARWVIASRASQVGGRWLMRVELFDSQSLKVTAQVTAMSDSVEGLAQQAESLADQLLARAPVLRAPPTVASTTPAASASSSSTASSSSPENTAPSSASSSPAGDASNARPLWPWLVAGGSGVVAVGALAGWAIAYGVASNDESKLNQALVDFQHDPSSANNRSALAAAGRSADTSSTANNCVFAPLGCLSLPLIGLGAAGVYWGTQKAPAENHE